MKKIFFFCLIGMILFAPTIGAGQEGEHSTFGAVWRSLILPGWGQFYNKTPHEGINIVLAEGFLVSAAIVTQHMSSEAYDKYMQATTQEEIEKYYTQANRYHYFNNQFVIEAIIVWFYGILDAYYAGMKMSKKFSFKVDGQEFKVFCSRKF